MSGTFRLMVLDDEAEEACDGLAQAMYPYTADADRRWRLKRALVRFMQVAHRGRIA